MLTKDIPLDVGQDFPVELTPSGYSCWIVKFLLECTVNSDTRQIAHGEAFCLCQNSSLKSDNGF